MTELKVTITLDQLAQQAEPIDVAALLSGDLLEVLRLRKDLEIILHFVVGRESDDPETESGLETVREQSLDLMDKINHLQLRSVGPIDCGRQLAESFAELRASLGYLVDLLDPRMVLTIRSAILAS